MRALVACVFLVGCKNDPLYDDMKMFCRAVDVTQSKEVGKWGPYIAEHAETAEVKALLVSIKDGNVSIFDFLAKGRELAAKAKVDPCPTLDQLSARRPD
jgi:hypothetical protein